MMEMIVGGLTVDYRTGQPIVVLADIDKRRALPIWIGVAEALAISQGLSHENCGRPMTHDLLLNAIEELGYTVEQVDLNEIQESTFLATIRLSPSSAKGGEEKALDARPSDAIAIALRVGASIYATEEVMLKASLSLDVERDEEEEREFKMFLQSVKPSDFRLDGHPPQRHTA